MLVAGFISDFMAQSDYPKSCQESVRYSSIALCAVSISVRLPLALSPQCLCVVYYIRVLVYYSIFRKNQKRDERFVGNFVSHRDHELNRRLSSNVLGRGMFYFSQSSRI